MPMSMKDLERQLQIGAEFARQTPPSRLRTRTLAALRETESAAASAPRIQHAPRWSLAFAAVFMIGAAVIGYLQFGGNSSVVQPDGAPVARTTLTLPRITIRSAQVSISAPLRNELQLIARDAERTVEGFRDQFAWLSQIDISLREARPEDFDANDTQSR